MASVLTNVSRNVTRCLIRTNISRTAIASRTLFSTRKQHIVNKYNNVVITKRAPVSVPNPFTKIFKSAYSTATSDDITESWNAQELKDYGVRLYKVPKDFPFFPPNQPKPEYVMSTVPITDFKNFNLGTRIVGWLKHAPPTDRNENFVVEPSNFIENQSFRNFLTHILVTYHTESETLKEQATATKHGLMQITDLRSRAAHRPATDDILGTVEIKDGVMQPATFEIMPIHRLVTRDGLFRLPHDMLKYLKDTKPIIVFGSMHNNANNTNVRTNNTNVNNSAGNNQVATNTAQPQEFSIRMVLDPDFVTKYGRLSDSIVDSIEVSFKREELLKNQTRGRKRDIIHKNNKKTQQAKPVAPDFEGDKDDAREAAIKEREISKAVRHLKLHIKPTPKYASHSPYAPQMADPIELADDIQRMELSE